MIFLALLKSQLPLMNLHISTEMGWCSFTRWIGGDAFLGIPRNQLVLDDLAIVIRAEKNAI